MTEGSTGEGVLTDVVSTSFLLFQVTDAPFID
jgi:hypothetical protein